MSEQKFHVGIKALILNDKNEILILKKEANAAYSIPQHWDLPGGRIKEGDSIETTLRKEVEEELGVSYIEIMSHFDGGLSNFQVSDSSENLGLVLLVYRCRFGIKKKIVLNAEHTEYKWSSISEAKKLLSLKFHKAFIDKLDELR